MMLREDSRTVVVGATDAALFPPEPAAALAEAVRQIGATGEPAQVTTIHELMSLFLVLRPNVHSARLRSDAAFCSVFLNDCLYLAHVLVVLPQAKHAHPATTMGHFLDLVCALRRLGDAQLAELVRTHQATLSSLVARCPLENVEANYDNADAAVGEVLVAAGQFFACCTELPRQVFKEVFVALVQHLGKDLLARLLQAGRENPSAEGAICLGQLLTRIVLAVEARGPEEWEQPHGWKAFRLAAQLVGAPAEDVLAHRSALQEHLSPDERQLLLAANPATRGRTDFQPLGKAEPSFEGLFAKMAR